MRLLARARIPKPLNARAFADEMFRAMEGINREIEKDFLKTVATWNNKPGFRVGINQTPDRTVGRVRTRAISGDKPPELIYYFISEGTKVRHAIMTDDFEPKTRRNVIDSFPGAGGLLRVDPRFDGPGIVGREFDVAIATKHSTRVPFRLQVALRKAVKDSGHQYT